MVWSTVIAAIRKRSQSIRCLVGVGLGAMLWTVPAEAQLFGSNAKQPNFSFRNVPSAATNPAARITPAGIYQGFDPRVSGSFLVPRDVNSYGYAYYFGQGDPAINSAAAYWLINETRGLGARSAPNASSTTQQNTRSRSGSTNAASTTGSTRTARANGRTSGTGESKTTARSAAYSQGNQPGGTAANRFSAYPTAAGSRVSDRFNRYDRRFNQLTPRR